MSGFSLPSHYGRTITTGRSNWSTMNPMRRISARLCQRHILRVMETSRRSCFGRRRSFPNSGSNSYPRRRRPLIAGKKIRLSAGAELQYGHLVLAVGARNRELRSPHEEGCIHYIRTLAETARLKERLLSARHVTVVGAGFIGLEFASAARLKGLTVDVIKLGQRLMERAVTPEISQFFLRRHERSGVNFHFGTEVAGIERGGGNGRYTIALAQGKKIETDLVVAGIGVNSNTELAASAGLVVNGGILVDQNMSTSDANISAIGDCVVFPTPYATKPVRIESVQNATDQASCLAARLIGKGAPYRSLPWFWSDQGSDKLQIVGLPHDVDRTAASHWPRRKCRRRRSSLIFSIYPSPRSIEQRTAALAPLPARVNCRGLACAGSGRKEQHAYRRKLNDTDRGAVSTCQNQSKRRSLHRRR